MDTINPKPSDQEIEVTNGSDNISARFQTSSKTVTEELSLKEIVKIFTSNWLLFIIIFSLTSAAAIGIYVFRTPFVATGSIVVNDAQNSVLQSFATQFFGLTKSVADGKKNNSPLQKHLEFLKTEEFFNQLLSDLKSTGLSETLTVAEKKGFQLYKEQFKEQFQATTAVNSDLHNKSVQKLDAMAKIKLSSDFEISVGFLSADKELSLYITNTALNTVAQSLKERELLEIIKVESFIKSQIELAEKNMLKKKYSSIYSHVLNNILFD